MAHFASNDGPPINLVEIRVGGQAVVQLWGDGPNGERLDVVPSDVSVVSVEEIPASAARPVASSDRSQGFTPVACANSQ